jgi:hypothetical protein
VKYATLKSDRPAGPTRAPIRSLLFAAALPLLLGACGDEPVNELGAQPNAGEPAAQAAEAPAAQQQEPTLAAADTASRTVAQALAMGERQEKSDTDIRAASGPGIASSQHLSENADFARRMGWPVMGPTALPGAILPDNRIVCYYGNPNSTRMGALGEFPKDDMLRRLRNQIGEWERADPETPVTPCLHMVAVVAQGDAGRSGHYRSIMRDSDVEKVYEWAREVNGIFIVDIQVGTDDIRNILPRFEWILKNPDVHLGIDPEFMMKDGSRPGSRIGTMDAADINYASEYLANLVREHNLPPKVFVVHRFTQRMVTNYQNIKLRPEVQIVMHMDGWGADWLKRDTFRDYVVREPVQYAGFKIFYHNDTKGGNTLMRPADMLRLHPRPIYIQYQ